MKLTRAEADLLLPMGQTEFTGTVEDLKVAATNAFWVIDDAPYPHWERQKLMNVLSGLAAKYNFEIGE